MKGRGRLDVALLVLFLLGAACTGGDDGVEPTPAPTPAPAPPATVEPATTLPPSTTPPEPPPPTTTTTTLPPGLDPQVLTVGYQPGDLVTYRGTLETRIAVDGSDVAATDGEMESSSLDFVAEWGGRQRLLVLDAGGLLEVIEDFTAESGVVTIDEDGDQTTRAATRDELLDFKPPTPPLVIDTSIEKATGGRSGAPGALGFRPDAVTLAAIVGPPLAQGPVDEGDSWAEVVQDDLLGDVEASVAIVGELEGEGDDRSYSFDIEFSVSATTLPVPLGIEDVLGLVGVVGDQRTLEMVLSSGEITGAELRAMRVDGRLLFDPALGLAKEFDSLQTYAVDLASGSGEETGRITVEVGVFRSFVLDDRAPAAPFEVESVLDRFQVEPSALAAITFDSLAGYEMVDTESATVDHVFDVLDDVRQDLFAGIVVSDVVDGDGATSTVVAVTTGGEFRGAPFVAEEVAAFLSGTQPRSVAIGGPVAFRVPVGDEEWLLYNTETHLFVAIGPQDLAERVLTDLAHGTVPYLWQPGDCLDFSDDFDSATPFAPFGIHGLRHCSTDHTYEVIHSEILPEGPDARFPSDIDLRSEVVCGRAFFELTGASELQTALSLTRYLPNRDEWEKGARYLGCMVHLAGPNGQVELNRRVNGADPDLFVVLEMGTCLFELFPVDCGDPHNGEIIALLDLPDGPDAPIPDPGDLLDEMSDECRATFASFELGSGPGSVQVRAISDLLGSWERGARRYYCMALVFGDDGFRLDITGTFSGGWREADDRIAA